MLLGRADQRGPASIKSDAALPTMSVLAYVGRGSIQHGQSANGLKRATFPRGVASLCPRSAVIAQSMHAHTSRCGSRRDAGVDAQCDAGRLHLAVAHLHDAS